MPPVGGRWIRTFSTAEDPRGSGRSGRLSGCGKISQRRDEAVSEKLFVSRRTKGSNLVSSSKESSNFRFLSGGRIAREQRVEIRRVARDAMIVAVRVGRAAVVGAAPLPLPDAPSKEGSAGSIALPTACRASRQRDRAVRLPDRVIPESIPKRRRRARSRWDRRLPLRPEQHADQLGTLIGDAAGRQPKLCFHSRPISQELQRLALRLIFGTAALVILEIEDFAH